MDEQHAQDTQQQTPPANTPPTNMNNLTAADMPEDTPLAPPPPITSIKQPKSKKGLIIGLIIALLLVGGAAAYWFVIKKEPEPAKPADNATSQDAKQETQKPVEPEPYGVVYKNGNTISDPLSLKQLDASKPAEKLIGSERASLTNVNGKYIVTATIADATTKKESVLLSTDEGKTFSTIYTGKPSTDNTSLGEQITSVMLSDDNTKVAFASLVYGDATTGNTVKVYDIASKSTKDIFTSDKAGVFFEKFMAKTGMLYYQVGCYNCDGAPAPILYAQNISSPKETIVYEDKTANVFSSFELNSTVTKVLVQHTNNNCDGLGGCKPFSVEEVDLATKKSSPLVTVTTDNEPQFGYSKTDEPYYSNESKLFTIKKNAAAPSVIFEGNATIRGVFYVDDTTAIFNAGAANSYTLYTFERSTSKSTELAKFTNGELVYGVIVK